MNLVISAGAILPQRTPDSNKNSMIEMIDNLINKQEQDTHAGPAFDADSAP